MKLAWIALAGAVGTISRYLLSGLAQRILGEGFPWGTLAVNLCGCLLFGFVWGLSERQYLLDPGLRVYILTGFMGAFTTFSTFAFETNEMLQDAEWSIALANLAANNIFGVALILLGLSVARWV
ncbi:MAG: putative fluoride ion transporter CrcB [Gemmatales bacterium]|nr:MAG: putative fluoride ion transporter CrcB [Gemmatales bacterium]